MKKSFKGILSAAACVFAVAAVSCQKDDTLYYNNLTMGNVVDGRFVSDQGNTFNVVEQTCDGKLDQMQRAMVLCDVLNETSGAKDEYDVRLTKFTSVQEKDPVPASEATDEKFSTMDPINIQELWYSGGYLNMTILFPVAQGSTAVHEINLIYTRNDDGTYAFNLRHNASGDVIDTDNLNNMEIAGAYVSFPITKVINEDKAKLTINWKWFKVSPVTGYGWDYTKEKDYSFEYDWQRVGFEQVPRSLDMKSTVSIR